MTCSFLGVKHLLGIQHDLPEHVKFPPNVKLYLKTTLSEIYFDATKK